MSLYQNLQEELYSRTMEVTICLRFTILYDICITHFPNQYSNQANSHPAHVLWQSDIMAAGHPMSSSVVLLLQITIR